MVGALAGCIAYEILLYAMLHLTVFGFQLHSMPVV